MRVWAGLVAVSLALSSSAWAQRLSVLNFKGPGAATVRGQLEPAVCAVAECVAPRQVSTAAGPDWKKAKKEKLAGVVTGTVAKKGRASVFTLQLLTKKGPPAASKTYPLDKGLLSDASVEAVLEMIRTTVGGGSPKPAPAPTPAPVPVEEPRAAPVEPPPAPQPDPVAVASAPTEPPPPVTAAAVRRQYIVAAELALLLLNRALSYSGLETANLRPYALRLMPLAAARVEFFPFALSRTDVLAGLGVEGGVGFASWLRSGRANVTESFPTSVMRVDAGLAWRLMPSRDIDFGITPAVGIRLSSFSVGAAADGATLDGLPNLAFFGVRAGLGLDLAVLDARLRFFARFSVVPVLSSGAIISPAFFASGSTLGLDATAGVGVRLVGGVSLRGAFDFTRYGMTFTTQPGDTYVATGAVEQTLGGSLALRFEY